MMDQDTSQIVVKQIQRVRNPTDSEQGPNPQPWQSAISGQRQNRQQQNRNDWIVIVIVIEMKNGCRQYNHRQDSSPRTALRSQFIQGDPYGKQREMFYDQHLP
jgi:hypothetical protein